MDNFEEEVQYFIELVNKNIQLLKTNKPINMSKEEMIFFNVNIRFFYEAPTIHSYLSIINLIDYFGIQDIADQKAFEQLTVSEQKLVLFIRALVKMPEVLILDEAFSGMEVEPVLRCYEFLESWPGTVLVIAHVANETPKCDHFIKLMGPGKYIIGDVEK